MTEVVPDSPTPLIYPESHSHNPLPYSDTALGRAAVLAVEKELKYAADIEALPPDTLPVTDLHIDHLAANIRKKDALENVHDNLDYLAANENATDYLDEYFGKKVPPIVVAWRSYTTQPPMAEKSWAKWLAEDATDDQIVNVLQWSSENIHHYNTDPDFQQHIEQRRTKYINQLEKIHEAGYLYPEGWDDIKDTVTHTKVYAADIFQLAKRSTNGVKDVESNRMLILPEKLQDKTASTFEHELSHFVAHPERWIDELSADLLAGMVKTGSFDPKVALQEAIQKPTHAYRLIDAIAVHSFLDTPQKAKAFLRYYSAPSRQKAAARKELNLACSDGESADTDILDIADKPMSMAL